LPEHDLRSILTHLKSNGAALIREAEGKTSARKRAARLADDLEFLERTLNDMGEFSTPPKLDNHREKVREVVTSALEMARSNVQADGFDPESVAATLKVPPAMAFEVTKPLVVMALANVLKNAFESYAKPDGTLAKGKVTIEAKQDGDGTRLSIRDGGKGFSDAEWTAYQALLPGRANKSKRRSTGYGLAITRRNIEVHGGKVHVRTKEDKGTTVTITLPASGKGR